MLTAADADSYAVNHTEVEVFGRIMSLPQTETQREFMNLFNTLEREAERNKARGAA